MDITLNSVFTNMTTKYSGVVLMTVFFWVLKVSHNEFVATFRTNVPTCSVGNLSTNGRA